MLPTVTVFVPCYNYGRYLRQCVDSIRSQDGVETYVLIIDDTSTDNTPLIGREIAENDSHVEFRRHGSNLGHIATYNEGIRWAFGDYTTLLSADDLLTPGALMRATTALHSHDNATFAYGRVLELYGDGDWESSIATLPRTGGYVLRDGHDWIEDVCRLGRNTIRSPEVLVRTGAQKDAGGYDSDLPHTADLDMWLRLAARGDVCILDSIQAGYRIHDNNMHHLEMSPLLDLEQRQQAFEIFFSVNRDLLPNAEQLHKLAITNTTVNPQAVQHALRRSLESSTRVSTRAAIFGRAAADDPKAVLFNPKLLGNIARIVLGPGGYNRLYNTLARRRH